ncbi:MAG: DNA-processing protein DprA, partial [Angelakisella sp.]
MSATLHWIMFQRVFGYGTTRARKIMDIIGTPSKLIEASISDAQGAKLFTRNELTLLRKREELQNEAKKTLEAALKLNCKVLTPDSDGYPQRLRDIYSPPSVLYVLGSLDVLDEAPAIGMVGTRRNTDYGKRVADDLA